MYLIPITLDAVEKWEEKHPELWVDGHCEYFRELLRDAISAHEKLIEELAYDCQDVVDMWYEILAGWSDIPPDGDSEESPSFLLSSSPKSLCDFE